VIEEETGLDWISLQGTGSYVGANIVEETKSLLQTPTLPLQVCMDGWLALALSFPSVLFAAHFIFKKFNWLIYLTLLFIGLTDINPSVYWLNPPVLSLFL
jgi:hypothetical protein